MATTSNMDILLDLVSEATGVDRSRLSDDTSLFHDLGVAGFDGAELLQTIGARFGIDLSEVDWCSHFGPELPYNPFHHLWCVLRGRRLDQDIIPLRIFDLKQTVLAGTWQAPGD